MPNPTTHARMPLVEPPLDVSERGGERRTLADGNERVVVRRGRGGAAGSAVHAQAHDR